jgi:tetratricopeptide (TPR) repeat protein/tRNA A-37 threonylcarbamoyl transferase component Bud32
MHDTDNDNERWHREPRMLEVVTTYLDAVGDGLVPDRQALLAEYSDIAEELEDFLDAQDHVSKLTAPLRDVARAATLPLLATTLAFEHDEDPALAPDPRLAAVLEERGYELLGEGARGGAGVVYKARHRRLNRLVAVKTIGVGRQVSPLDLQRFRNEAEILGALRHPLIVPVYEVAESAGRLYLFMPYLEGGSLAGDLEKYCDDPRAAASLVTKVASAVHHAHRHGILHRDLKPSNILLDEAGEPHVSDFGLAKRLDENVESGLTVSGAILGTPSYMAPEQAQSQGRRGAPTTSTDVYGLGAVLYALLTGRPPFRGDTPLDTIEMVRSSTPVRPGTLNPRVDRDLETICLKCLEKEPKARYASALDLAEDLERWLAGEPIAARPIGPAARAWRWARRNPGVTGLAAALILVLVTAGISTVRERSEAIYQRAIALRERDRAQANLGFAHRVIDHFVTDVARSGLENEPRLEKLLRAKLAEAANYYQALTRQDDADSASRNEAAFAHTRLGQIHQLLGELSPAERSFRTAIAFFEQLQILDPGAASYLHGRLEAMIGLATVHAVQMDKQNCDEAERLYRRSIELSHTLAARFPDALENEWFSALAHFGLADILQVDRRLTEAFKSSQRSLALADALCRRVPDDARYVELLARSHRQLGLISYAESNRDEALNQYRQALSTYEKLPATDVANPRHRNAKAATLHNLAIILHELGDLEGAESAYRSAIVLSARLVDEFPAVPHYRSALASHYTMLAGVLADTKRRNEAGDARRAAVKIVETLIDDFPHAAPYRMLLANCRLQLADFEASQGRHGDAEVTLGKLLSRLQSAPSTQTGTADFQSAWATAEWKRGELLQRRGDRGNAQKALEAALDRQRQAARLSRDDPAHYEQMLRVADDYVEQLFAMGESAAALRVIETTIQPPRPDPMNYFQLAVFLGNRSVEMANGPSVSLPEAKRRELAPAYADRAVEYLHKALEAGFGDLKLFLAQHAFDCLKGREDFKAIVLELERNQRAKGDGLGG